MRALVCCLIGSVIFVWQALSYAGILGNVDMNTIYKDQSHCIVAPELRGEEENRISCYCRDSIVDARYVYGTYVLEGKDRNLNGAYLTFEDHARQMCGDRYDVECGTLIPTVHN
jgi:hypothetical protein